MTDTPRTDAIQASEHSVGLQRNALLALSRELEATNAELVAKLGLCRQLMDGADVLQSHNAELEKRVWELGNKLVEAFAESCRKDNDMLTAMSAMQNVREQIDTLRTQLQRAERERDEAIRKYKVVSHKGTCCACKFDEDDSVLSLCAAHSDYVNALIPPTKPADETK